MDGLGEYFYGNGAYYMGYWKNNKMEGQGVYFEGSGEYEYGEYKNGIKFRDLDIGETKALMKIIDLTIK